MSRVQKAVFPGTFVGILFLFLFTNSLAGTSKNIEYAPTPVQAVITSDNPTPDQPIDREAPPENAGCVISSSFPDSIQRWCSQISQYAIHQGIDPNLIAAVMLQESGGNPDAFSKSGAVGLMQVMPKDGPAARFQCINGPCFASRPSTTELYEPDFNIEYGTRMLSNLIARYGNVRDALKAYGPMDMGYRYADIVLSILEKHSQASQ